MSYILLHIIYLAVFVHLDNLSDFLSFIFMYYKLGYWSTSYYQIIVSKNSLNQCVQGVPCSLLHFYFTLKSNQKKYVNYNYTCTYYPNPYISHPFQIVANPSEIFRPPFDGGLMVPQEAKGR